jgi:phenylacetate-coenzyme A ligase PaaK-like adenylate-forming protein
MTNRLSKEEYDQMASEISGASVSVWDEGLECTEDGIILETLWPILDKYLKPKEDGKISD